MVKLVLQLDHAIQRDVKHPERPVVPHQSNRIEDYHNAEQDSDGGTHLILCANMM
jgi:hypothetical protein